MKQFLSKFFVFLFLKLLFIIAFIIFFETNQSIRSKMQSTYLNGYNIILNDIKSYTERKIIFVGGSNVGFGLNSKRIEDSLGVKTFNFGVHGGIGLKKSIEDICKHLKSEDIIVLSPEYINFKLNYYWNEKYRVQFLNSFGFLLVKDLETLIHYIEHIKFFLIDGWFIKSKYNLNWFNENGDVIGHYGLENERISKHYKMLIFDTYDLQLLKDFIEQKLYGIEYYFIPPVTNEFRFNLKEENELNQTLMKIFEKNYPIPIKSLTFGNECFYDTQYHLNYICKEKRTDIVLEFLKSVGTKSF